METSEGNILKGFTYYDHLFYPVWDVSQYLFDPWKINT